MENKQYLDETGLSEVGKVIKEHYASKEDLSKIDVTKQLVDYAKKTEVPTKLSQLTNDNSFKTEDEIKQLINDSNKLKKEVVTSLPSSGVDDVVYLLKNKSDSNNACTEYLWIDGKWEIIGDTKVDLTDYAKKTDLDNMVHKIDGKGLSTHDFTDENLQSVKKMELEQKKLEIIKDLQDNGYLNQKTAIISGDYGLVAINGFIFFEDDYSNIYTNRDSEHILTKIKNQVVKIPDSMQLTVKREELIDKDKNITYHIVQTLYDPFTGLVFGKQTKTAKKEYLDEEVLKKINIENVWDLENVVPEDDWYPWALHNSLNCNAIAVYPGKLSDGFSCGLMTPDDKLKLDSIDVEAIKSVISNSNNNNTVKFCDVEKEVLSKGADAPIGFYIDNTKIGDVFKIYRIFIDEDTKNKSYQIDELPLNYGVAPHRSMVYSWQNSQWELQLSGPLKDATGSIADQVFQLEERIKKLESKISR